MEIGTYTPENFFAGDYPIAKETAAVKAGATVTRHAPVKLAADGTVSPVTLATATEVDEDNAIPAKTAAENTVAGLYGIAADGGADGADITVYLTGDFFADALTLEAGVTAAILKPAFRNIGIFLR
ncbi:hypothetical protein FACS18949_18040 [Clostridia bacterium]|nr:hypothetical protein FACS189425_09250 [Clostridia bacterium]GHV37690.1 hypothetical protein FACS18949_18040 [Clostridia bacterium]